MLNTKKRFSGGDTPRQEQKISKILTFLRQRSDFVAHKWDFGRQKRRFKILKRRFCFAVSETR